LLTESGEPQHDWLAIAAKSDDRRVGVWGGVLALVIWVSCGTKTFLCISVCDGVAKSRIQLVCLRLYTHTGQS